MRNSKACYIDPPVQIRSSGPQFIWRKGSRVVGIVRTRTCTW